MQIATRRQDTRRATSPLMLFATKDTSYENVMGNPSRSINASRDNTASKPHEINKPVAATSWCYVHMIMPSDQQVIEEKFASETAYDFLSLNQKSIFRVAKGSSGAGAA